MRAQLQQVWLRLWRGRAPLGWVVLCWLTLFQCTREQPGAQIRSNAPSGQSAVSQSAAASPDSHPSVSSTPAGSKPNDEQLAPGHSETAILAGGCFWGMEEI